MRYASYIRASTYGRRAWKAQPITRVESRPTTIMLQGFESMQSAALRSRAGTVQISGSGNETWEIPRGVNTTYLTHGLFRYAGKLPPPLAAYLVEQYSPPGGVVVDPMSGGGTTAIEAVSSGRQSHNFDINPVSRIVTEAVAHPPSDLEAFTSFAETVATEFKPSTPPPSLAEYFNRETYGLLRAGLDGSESAAQQALFLSIARRASFANTKKINTVVDKTKVPADAVGLLRRSVTKYTRAYEELSALNSLVPLVGSSRADKLPLPSGIADLVVLHPPYLTNTAFSEVTHLQLLLLGEEPRKLRDSELAFRGSYFHVPNGLRKYLVGWSKILEEAMRLLKPGGHVAAINGDGRIDGVRIPIGSITREFGEDLGMVTVRQAFHKLNNHTGMTLSRRMTGQHVIVFRKEE